MWMSCGAVRVRQLEVERGKVVAMMESAGRTCVLPKQQPQPKTLVAVRVSTHVTHASHEHTCTNESGDRFIQKSYFATLPPTPSGGPCENTLPYNSTFFQIRSNGRIERSDPLYEGTTLSLARVTRTSPIISTN